MLSFITNDYLAYFPVATHILNTLYNILEFIITACTKHISEHDWYFTYKTLSETKSFKYLSNIITMWTENLLTKYLTIWNGLKSSLSVINWDTLVYIVV